MKHGGLQARRLIQPAAQCRGLLDEGGSMPDMAYDSRPCGTDYDMEDKYGGCTEGRFRMKKDLVEGVAGQARIDTTFENTERPQVLRPRSLDRGPNQIGGRSPANVAEPGRDEWEGGPYRPPGAY